LKEVRPYKVFALPAAGEIARIPFPRHRGAGGLTLLETFVLIALAKAVNARRIFEFGTFYGSTTYNLALNTSAEVITLDLDPETAHCINQNEHDAPLTSIHLASQMDFARTDEERRITRLQGNSTTFLFSPWHGSMDMVFVDGGHDLATASADTENARRLLNGGPSVIAWHDYRNPEHPHLTGFFDDLSQRHDLFHIGDTMLCVHFRNFDTSSL